MVFKKLIKERFFYKMRIENRMVAIEQLEERGRDV